jgi:putative ATP-grasp target RiPP
MALTSHATEPGGTLAPPMFPRAGAPAPAGPPTTAVRPFGLTKAVPVTVPEAPAALPVLSLCPERQINVTDTGVPYVHAPSMQSSFLTQSQTREDSQLATDTENDTD